MESLSSQLTRWLILDMALDVSYNSTAHEGVVHFDEDPEAPTVKYPWLEYLVFALCIPFALLVVAMIFFLCRRHDRHNKAKRDAEKFAQYDCLRDKIKCKPWCHPDEQSRAFDRSVMYGNSTNVSPFGSKANTSARRTVCPDPPVGGHAGFRKAHNGFYCVICVEAFSPGEPVYNSNNPDCKHQIHMKCMDTWISHQNMCPVCNHPFVILRPHEGDWMSVTKPRNDGNRGSLTALWRSLRGSDNHRKEFASVIARSTVAYPAKILEEEGVEIEGEETKIKPPIVAEADSSLPMEEAREEAGSVVPADVEQGTTQSGNSNRPPMTDSVLSI